MRFKPNGYGYSYPAPGYMFNPLGPFKISKTARDEVYNSDKPGEYNPSKKEKKCECGKEKHNFIVHQKFCPMYDPEKMGT